LRGVPRQESLRRFLNSKQISAEQTASWLERKNDYYHQSLAGMTASSRLPGVGELLEEARAAGIKMAVASASRNAHAVLEKLQLLDYFEVVTNSNSVANPKPAADVFIWAAGYLRAPIIQTVVFEDAESGIDAALNAGFWTVGIGAGNVNHAHISRPDLKDFGVQDILTHINEIFSGREKPAM
jgi:beta-phosphoglucomutase